MTAVHVDDGGLRERSSGGVASASSTPVGKISQFIFFGNSAGKKTANKAKTQRVSPAGGSNNIECVERQCVLYLWFTVTTPELCIEMQLSGSRDSWWSALAVERCTSGSVDAR